MSEILKHDPYSAGEQGLGYIYQSRLALLKLLQLPENNSILIEADDDLELQDENGMKTLASLKHKASGDMLSNLSTDFWKSVNIWLDRYTKYGKSSSDLRFFLITTSSVADTSFLQCFVDGASGVTSRSNEAITILDKTISKVVTPVATKFKSLNDGEKEDFLSRIVIFHHAPRIIDIPQIIIEKHMRSIRREFRIPVFERLEGWWNDLVINLLAGKRKDPVYGYEVSDKLSAFADEYKSDSLPITFRGKMPGQEVDVDTDPRLFVSQLRALGISSNRIHNAILDYYRAFQQRSEWARQNLLISGEIEEYEDRLVDEWGRYKDVIFDGLDIQGAEADLRKAGEAVYRWAEFESDHIKIRERVTEPYVVRGGFHILANSSPTPRIFWHPLFLDRLSKVLKAAS